MTLLVLIVLLAAELPDPGKPATVPLAGTLGAFAGGLLAACRGRRDVIPRGMAEGSLAGCAVGVLAWIAAFAIDRL